LKYPSQQSITMSQHHVTTPNKECMTAPKGSPRWILGVQSFIQFTTESLGEGIKEFRCPCMKFKNYGSLPKSLDDVHGHILIMGSMCHTGRGFIMERNLG
ncbi:hypothetical protein MKW98_006047, partial [Papaver atlanticum]